MKTMANNENDIKGLQEKEIIEVLKMLHGH